MRSFALCTTLYMDGGRYYELKEKILHFIVLKGVKRRQTDVHIGYFLHFVSRRNLILLHSVEISWFFYHSDFTWNQIWGFWKCKICHFNTFIESEFWFLWIFALCHSWKWPKIQILSLQNCKKCHFLIYLGSQKLISRKI